MESLSNEDRMYFRQSGLAGTLYSCDPASFEGAVTSREMLALSIYYFIDREVDVENVYEYRRALEVRDPDTVNRARSALRRMADAYGVAQENLRGVFE